MPRYTIPNLSKACRLLKTLAAADQPMRLSDLADSLDLPRSTALRVLRTLEEERFVEREEKNYSLGSALVPIGQRAACGVDVGRLARPILRRLTEATGETSQLVTQVSGKAWLQEVNDSPHPLAAHSRPGSFVDLHSSATGKTLLAHLPEEEMTVIMSDMLFTAHTAASIQNKEQLLLELAKVRKQGFALDDEEYHEGIRCVAAPVIDSLGQVRFSIGLTASIQRFRKGKIPEFSRHVKQAARDLGDRLGL